MPDKRHVFISYSRKDTEVMQRLKRSFDASGIPHWTDEGITPGTPSWKRAIGLAIEESGCIVCILSPDAKNSEWVQRELDYADAQRVPIYPLMARGDEATAIPFALIGAQFVDIRIDYDGGINRLLSVLRRIFELAEAPDSLSSQPEPETKTSAPPRIEVVTHTPTPVVSATDTGRILTLEEAPIDYSQIKPVTHNKEWTPIIRIINSIEMCLVPPGCFMMGSKDIKNAQPVHERCFDKPFWIGRYPVTNAQYTTAVKAGVCQPARLVDDKRFGHPMNPVVGVDWYEVREYAEWRGMRLSTEGEWEYAARGPDNLLWPWGNKFVTDNLIYKDNSNGRTAYAGHLVGGVSWVGALDMSGNVWEWCLTKWRQTYNEQEDNDPAGNAPRVVRGGSWDFVHQGARCTSRLMSLANHGISSIGFRLAADSNL